MKRLPGVIIAVIFSTVFSCYLSEAKAAQEDRTESLSAVEFLSGFGYAKIADQDRYRLIPLCVDFDFDISKALENIGFHSKGLQQFIVEPFTSIVYSPDANAEVGTNAALKFGLVPSDWMFQPYVKGAVGIVYLTQHFREQSTQFNFNEYAAAGFHYFLTKHTALTAEFRFRHVSNADIKRPNSGISTKMGLLGVSYFF